jgi:hypothetical protein
VTKKSLALADKHRERSKGSDETTKRGEEFSRLDEMDYMEEFSSWLIEKREDDLMRKLKSCCAD